MGRAGGGIDPNLEHNNNDSKQDVKMEDENTITSGQKDGSGALWRQYRLEFRNVKGNVKAYEFIKDLVAAFNVFEYKGKLALLDYKTGKKSIEVVQDIPEGTLLDEFLFFPNDQPDMNRNTMYGFVAIGKRNMRESLKNSREIMQVLRKHKAFMFSDTFEGKIPVASGFMWNTMPTAFDPEEMEEAMTEQIAERYQGQTIAVECSRTIVSMGKGEGRIETQAIEIKCMRYDAAKVRETLASVYSENYCPYKYRNENSEAFEEAIVSQNKYLARMRVAVVRNLPHVALYDNEPTEEKTFGCQLEEKEYEQGRRYFEEIRHLEGNRVAFIYDKVHEKKVFEIIDDWLPKVYQKLEDYNDHMKETNQKLPIRNKRPTAPVINTDGKSIPKQSWIGRTIGIDREPIQNRRKEAPKNKWEEKKKWSSSASTSTIETKQSDVDSIMVLVRELQMRTSQLENSQNESQKSQDNMNKEIDEVKIKMERNKKNVEDTLEKISDQVEENFRIQVTDVTRIESKTDALGQSIAKLKLKIKKKSEEQRNIKKKQEKWEIVIEKLAEQLEINLENKNSEEDDASKASSDDSETPKTRNVDNKSDVEEDENTTMETEEIDQQEMYAMIPSNMEEQKVEEGYVPWKERTSPNRHRYYQNNDIKTPLKLFGSPTPKKVNEGRTKRLLSRATYGSKASPTGAPNEPKRKSKRDDDKKPIGNKGYYGPLEESSVTSEGSDNQSSGAGPKNSKGDGSANK